MPTYGLFEIESERETDSGWIYEITRSSGEDSPAMNRTKTRRVSLSWHDHDLISGGTAAPSATMEAVCRLLAEHSELASRLPCRVDVSTLRRHIADFDCEVQRRIGPVDPAGG